MDEDQMKELYPDSYNIKANDEIFTFFELKENSLLK